jgi:hydrogenase maturation protease
LKIAVMSLGNVLMGDDALGPTVIAHLRAGYDFPAEVEIEDLGTPGLDLHPHLAGHDALILVDVVKSKGGPGELRQYRKDEILKHPPQPRVSPHDPGLKEALLGLQFAGDDPQEVLLVGVIPGKIPHLEVGLTPEVAAAVPVAMAAILDELERLGCPAAARANPGEPDLWWEKHAGESEAGS